MPFTWVIVGASRGIGLEFARQLLARGDQVIAAVRNPATANQLWQLMAAQTRPHSCIIDECDVTQESSINVFVDRVRNAMTRGIKINGIILNAGMLKYPNRATEISYSDFALHLFTNTIGPIIVAQKLLDLTGDTPPSKIVFMSSDSGSATSFLTHEDGFGAYSASKAALNQMLRHMAEELKRKGNIWQRVCVLAMHPGEVQTDMANIDLDWEVEGLIQPSESVEGMLRVIDEKTSNDSGSFWRWDGQRHPW